MVWRLGGLLRVCGGVQLQLWDTRLKTLTYECTLLACPSVKRLRNRYIRYRRSPPGIYSINRYRCSSSCDASKQLTINGLYESCAKRFLSLMTSIRLFFARILHYSIGYFVLCMTFKALSLPFWSRIFHTSPNAPCPTSISNENWLTQSPWIFLCDRLYTRA